MELNEYIYPLERRMALRNHPSFPQMKEIWNLIGTPERTGNLSYLLKQAIEEKGEAPLKLTEWISFYFSSGKKRNLDGTISQNALYCGRTLEELYELAMELKEAGWKKGFRLHDKGALNMVFIQVIDETYDLFVRIFRCLPYIRQKYPQFAFEYSSPYDSMYYDVDIMAKKENVLCCALQIVPPSKEQCSREKHDTFKSVYDVPVKVVEASLDGKISAMPILV